ncbi:hypothetical protein FRC01_007015 [Tulasnella sp. 417]|nr:hypothetical protein FRC01_007015 [Tulasnella sp. 417]
MSRFLSFCTYNDWWKKQRSHFKHALSGGAVKRDYSPLLEAKAQEYVARCVARPESALSEANRIAAETTIKLTYGKLQDDRGRDYFKISGRISDILTYAAQGYVVDLFPALQHLPMWLPGMKFKRDAAQWKKEIQEGVGAVFELVKGNALSDDPDVTSSFVYKKMQELHEKHQEETDVQQKQEDEMALAFSGFAIYIGGLETTECTVESLVRAMILFPSVQKKVHEEMDRVIGSDRFPTFNDEPDLPYLHAVFLENLRWHPVASSGKSD